MNEELLSNAVAIADRRFAHVDTAHPAMSAIYRLACRHIATALEGGIELPLLPMPPMDPPSIPEQAIDPFDLLRGDLTLPSLPSVYAELQAVIADKDSSASDVAGVISRDTSLTAFLLRLVNSAFYSFPSQIDTISRAVAVVGTSQLSTLALGTSVMRMFTGIPEALANMEEFWRHSIRVGIIARSLARAAGGGEPERFFVAGLLHDVGRLAMCKLIPERFAAVIAYADEHHALLHETERGVLGFDHATLGGMLLRKWNLPFTLVSAVLNHHAPSQAEQDGHKTTIIHLADIMARGLDTDPGPRVYVPPLDTQAWSALELDPDQLAEAFHSCTEQMDATLRALAGLHTC
ncbi:putative nucleotidyltransferase with HDIG domain [Desulfobaculum xiamenense]|uniref:Putative nucleotidyltransferase with HDIG domain n=1 Tax=Desulfobaculum xiamenense TaxID=995050 RepID=A0A846QJT6_9BACT|nr:HDOD domain-containing protein [Desulfobaculum xiamenense]NJB68478.1 putative nucleotidyltransferase with HDIG domain [Desulfobaculum xiamenense]